MIDSAELKRLMAQIGSGNPYVGPGMLMLPVAQAAYKIGAKRMQERAAAECDPTYTVLDVKRYILKLEIE